MADRYYQAGWRTDGLLDPMPGPTDGLPAGPTAGSYQEGWHRPVKARRALPAR